MISNLLIGLREGLEAALVVTILLSYLVRTERRSKIRWVWLGVVAAIVLSLGFGALLTYTRFSLLNTFTAQEIFGGVMSIIAVGLVTWMIIWMRDTGKKMKTELHSKLDTAVQTGVATVALMAFVAVAREGLESALFFFSTVNAASSTLEPTIGFLLGVALAAVIGWALYSQALRINIGKFFSITSYFLIFVAAGVLSYGIHDLQEAGVLPGLNDLLFDVSDSFSVDTWVGALAKGIFNFSPQTSWLEAVAWAGYVIFAIWLFTRNRSTQRETPVSEKV
ncbi:high-affinity iron transporter [Microbacteriaceae bacterium MWH-Ta3]|nr:high-affinity iron transporter [Microbacteriaceae bacterium MWH-Ta3]